MTVERSHISEEVLPHLDCVWESESSRAALFPQCPRLCTVPWKKQWKIISPAAASSVNVVFEDPCLLLTLSGALIQGMLCEASINNYS